MLGCRGATKRQPTFRLGNVIAKVAQKSADAPPDGDDQKQGRSNRWLALVRATASPLKLFALIVLICNSVFGVAAAWSFGEHVFVYTLHTFLFVVGSFVLVALWSPRSFYSPSELAALAEVENMSDQKIDLLPSGNPLKPTLILGAFLLAYGAFQLLQTLVTS